MTRDELMSARKTKAETTLTRYQFADGSTISHMMDDGVDIEKLLHEREDPFNCDGDTLTLKMLAVNTTSLRPMECRFVVTFSPDSSYVENATMYVDGKAVGYELKEFTAQEMLDNIIEGATIMKNQCLELEWFSGVDPTMLIRQPDIDRYKAILADDNNKEAVDAYAHPDNRDWMCGFIEGVIMASDLTLAALDAKSPLPIAERLSKYLDDNEVMQNKYVCISQIDSYETEEDFNQLEAIELLNYLANNCPQEFDRLEGTTTEYITMIGEANGLLAGLRLFNSLGGSFASDVACAYQQWPDYSIPSVL